MISKFKKLSRILAIVFVISVFYSQAVIADIQDPFVKTAALNSYESNMKIKLSLSANNLSDNEKQVMQQLLPVFSNLGIDLYMKTNKNPDASATNAYIKMNMNISAFPINMEMWEKSETKDGKLNPYIIMKMPQGIPGAGNGSKEYMIIDYSKLSNTMVNTTNINLSQLTQSANKLLGVLYKLISDFNENHTIVSDQGTGVMTTTEGSINVHQYEIKMGDTDFKALIKYIADHVSDNKEIMDSIMSLVKMINTSNTNVSVDKLTQGLGSLLNNLDDIKILGDKGLVLDYSVNQDGYIVSEKGTIDLLLDMGKLMKLLDSSGSSSATGIYELVVDLEASNYNLNKQLSIDFPQITPDNSMDIMDLVKPEALQSDNSAAVVNSASVIQPEVKVTTPAAPKVTPKASKTLVKKSSKQAIKKTARKIKVVKIKTIVKKTSRKASSKK